MTVKNWETLGDTIKGLFTLIDQGSFCHTNMFANPFSLRARHLLTLHKIPTEKYF